MFILYFMPGKSKFVITVVLVVGVVGLLLGLKTFLSNTGPIAKPDPVVKLSPRSLGNPQAPIKIIEFIDFQCPACAKGYHVIHEYLQKYPDKFNVEMRYFPLAMHRYGKLSSQWGECASRQGKFWPFLNILIERQNEWAAMMDPLPSFRAIAKDSGVDADKIEACLKDPGVDQTIAADIEEGKLRQVSSTPSYFVNHEMIVGVKSLKKKIDELLGIKAEPVAPSPDRSAK